MQEAVQGKLTEEWRQAHPDVESATVLLEKIKAEKAQLVQEKKIKLGKKQPPDENTLNSLKIPKNWVLVDLDDITQYITDGTHKTPTYTNGGRIFLSAQNIKPFKFMPEDHKYVSEEAYEAYINNRLAKKGDLLVARVGAGIGEVAVIDQNIEFAFYVSLSLIKCFKELNNPKYFALVFNSPYGVNYAKGNVSSKGGSTGNFNLGRIRSFPIPLPSFDEQQAIVEKVEKLLAKVSQLEEEVQQNQQRAEQLLQSVLREVMQPNADQPGTVQPKEQVTS